MSESLTESTPLQEIAFYYPNHMWYRSDWVKSLILFFDGIAILVPNYMTDRPEQIDPVMVAGLKNHNLLHIIEPETAVDKDATERLANVMTNIIASGALDSLATPGTKFHELSRSRMGYYGDEGLAEMIFEELKKRGLARDTEDGVSIPLHPMVRYLILVFLAQILRSHGDKLHAQLSPATDTPKLVDALQEFLSLESNPSTGRVIAFDMNIVGVDLSPVPIDEVLDFRKQNLSAHRLYCLSVRKFTHELSLMDPAEQENAFQLRQVELDEIAQDLRQRSRKAWKKPASFALSLVGATWRLAAGDLLGTALALGSSILGYKSDGHVESGAYSYLFQAKGRF